MNAQTISTTATAAGVIEKTTAAVQPKAIARLLFVDNIRVFLTILVLLHHLMISYAGTGSWIYNEGRQDMVTVVVGNWFTTVNQSYFMGLFLLISAYFVPGAYERKGPGRFIKDRLIRLGIPLALYSWIIHPVLMYNYKTITQQVSVSFWEYFSRQYFQHEPWIGSGPLWFVEILLIFTLFYVLWRQLSSDSQPMNTQEASFPKDRSIGLFILLMALGAFIIRLWLPMGWNFGLLNLQFPYFASYIALFIIGLVAFRRNWLLSLPEAVGRRWLWIGILLILLYPVIAFASGAMEDGTPFLGGWHWQSAVFTVFDSLLCVSLCIGLVYAFRRFANRQGSLMKFLSPNAYTAYIIHAPVITFTGLALRAVELHPLLKFGLTALVSIPVCFLLSSLIRKLPHTQRVLG